MNKLCKFKVSLLAAAFTLSAICASAQTDDDRYRGMDFILETGGFVGADGYRTNGFSPLTIAGGYTFSEHLFVGLGASLVIFTDYEWGNIPVFVRIKSAFLDSRLSPYAQLDAGFNLPVAPGPVCGAGKINGQPGWLFLYPEIGLRLKLKGRKAVHFGIGYMINNGIYSKSHYTSSTPGACLITVEESYFSGALSFKVGFTF